MYIYIYIQACTYGVSFEGNILIRVSLIAPCLLRGKEVECEGPQIGHKFTFDDVFIEIDESEAYRCSEHFAHL